MHTFTVFVRNWIGSEAQSTLSVTRVSSLELVSSSPPRIIIRRNEDLSVQAIPASASCFIGGTGETNEGGGRRVVSTTWTMRDAQTNSDVTNVLQNANTQRVYLPAFALGDDSAPSTFRLSNIVSIGDDAVAGRLDYTLSVLPSQVVPCINGGRVAYSLPASPSSSPPPPPRLLEFSSNCSSDVGGEGGNNAGPLALRQWSLSRRDGLPLTPEQGGGARPPLTVVDPPLGLRATVDASLLRQGEHTLTLSTTGLSVSQSIIITPEVGGIDPQIIRISSSVGAELAFNGSGDSSDRLRFSVEMPWLGDTIDGTYQWTLTDLDQSAVVPLQPLIRVPTPTLPFLALRPSALREATRYLLEVEAVGASPPFRSSLEIVPNTPPFGGDCAIAPPPTMEGLLVGDFVQYDVACTGWRGSLAAALEGPLTYQFNRGMMLGSSPSASSALRSSFFQRAAAPQLLLVPLSGRQLSPNISAQIPIVAETMTTRFVVYISDSLGDETMLQVDQTLDITSATAAAAAAPPLSVASRLDGACQLMEEGGDPFRVLTLFAAIVEQVNQPLSPENRADIVGKIRDFVEGGGGLLGGGATGCDLRPCCCDILRRGHSKPHSLQLFICRRRRATIKRLRARGGGGRDSRDDDDVTKPARCAGQHSADGDLDRRLGAARCHILSRGGRQPHPRPVAPARGGGRITAV